VKGVPNKKEKGSGDEPGGDSLNPAGGWSFEVIMGKVFTWGKGKSQKRGKVKRETAQEEKQEKHLEENMKLFRRKPPRKKGLAIND